MSYSSFGQLLAKEVIVLPNPSVFGKQVGKVPPLEMPKPEVDAVYPENIHLDLDGPVVCGIMVEYPAEIGFKRLVEAVNLKHKKWTRDPDGEMAKWGVTVWRNEDDRYAIQVSESKVIMIWLDRRITQEEVNETTRILFEDVIRRTNEAHQSTVTNGEEKDEKESSYDAQE